MVTHTSYGAVILSTLEYESILDTTTLFLETACDRILQKARKTCLGLLCPMSSPILPTGSLIAGSESARLSSGDGIVK